MNRLARLIQVASQRKEEQQALISRIDALRQEVCAVFQGYSEVVDIVIPGIPGVTIAATSYRLHPNGHVTACGGTRVSDIEVAEVLQAALLDAP